MIEDKENIKINEILEICANYINNTQNEEYVNEYKDMINSLVIRSYIPIAQKEILLRKALIDVKTVDTESYHFTTALEIAKTFDILLGYIVNLDQDINALWKDYDFYDILQLADIPGKILDFAAEDYYKCEQMLSDCLHFDNIKELLQSVNLASADEIQQLTKAFENFTLNTNPDILKQYNDILATEDPLLHVVKNSVEEVALKTVNAINTKQQNED